MNRTNTLVLGSLAFAAFVVVLFFWPPNPPSPCDGLFKQSERRLDLSIKAMSVEGKLILGPEQIQKLDASAQQTALRLKSCCIAREAGWLSQEQWLRCQSLEADYTAKLEDILSLIASAEAAQARGDQATVQEAKQAAQQAAQEATSIPEKFPPLPDPPPPPTPDGGITITPSALPTLVVSPVTRFSDPAILQVLIVPAGTDLSSFTPTQSSSRFGVPMVVEAGVYDVVIEPEGQSLIRLVGDVAVADGQRVTVDPNFFLSGIRAQRSNNSAFPPLAETIAVEAGTDTSDSFRYRFRIRKADTPLLVEPGAFDVYVKPENGELVNAGRGIEVARGAEVRVSVEAGLAVILYKDPKLEGFDLQMIYLVEAGTDLRKRHGIVQKSDAFGAPLLVTSGRAYDLVLKPVGGNPVKVERDIAPAAGEVVRLGGGL
jgi:hypothetical protein